MPYSSESGKAYIRNIVGRIKHDRMLDIGCGSGTYAKMFPDARWTGVEVWEPYIDEFNLNDLYEEIILADARSVRLATLGRFDVAMLGDVLEHMEKQDAQDLLERVKAIADTVIVSIPIGHYPQDAYNGNPHERHITDNWTHEDFLRTFGYPTCSSIENEIGIFVWLTNEGLTSLKTRILLDNDEQTHNNRSGSIPV
jgi:cyclopropane fatty-acyl-phospholipid synthase-like methyltransferase